MKKRDVPQDIGIYGQWHGINYATDENGAYDRCPTAGWEPTNIVNKQAWELILDEQADILAKVKNGELSPLAYHMAHKLMDVKVLAEYVGFPRWKVKRHLRPHIFKNLDHDILGRYAEILGITTEQLMEVP